MQGHVPFFIIDFNNTTSDCGVLLSFDGARHACMRHAAFLLFLHGVKNAERTYYPNVLVLNAIDWGTMS